MPVTDSRVVCNNDTAPNTRQSTTVKVSRYWILLSVSALILAGFLALFIMLGRTPVINDWLFNTQTFRRILVVHVNLALTVSFYSFICGLFVLIPSPKSSNRLLTPAWGLAVTGVALMLITIFLPSATPVLSNYIPMLNHPVFFISLGLFGLGMVLTLLNRRIIPLSVSDINRGDSLLPAAAIPALQSAAVLFLVSMLLFAGAWLITPVHFDLKTYFEFVLWGGGHILQFVIMAAAIAVWLSLLKQFSDKPLLSHRQSLILFAIYTVPVLFSPLLLVGGTTNASYLNGFTNYMQWGIFPVMGFIIILFISRLGKIFKAGNNPPNLYHNPYFNGLIASIIFILGGFILGAMIRGSSTMIPAHYHATLGGITIAFMVMAYRLLDHFGYPIPTHKIQQKAAIQPILYGIGQGIFVTGLAYAGAYGLARKVFGTEQIVNSTHVYIGLGLLAIGGTIAISGGVLFLWIVLKTWLYPKKS